MVVVAQVTPGEAELGVGGLYGSGKLGRIHVKLFQ